MKNTTFRKKALLSSVAMLLVAIVALGSATFAWFSSNANVTASGINVKTSQATNILISKDPVEDFGNSITFDGYDEAKTLIPVSNYAVASGNWYTSEAASWDSQAAVFNKTKTATGANYVAETFYIKYDAPTGSKNVNITGTLTVTPGDDGQDAYLRVALWDVTNNKLDYVWANSVDATEKQIVSLGTDAINYSESTNVTTSGTAISFSTSMAAAAVNEYKVFVWYEGCDVDCKDSNAVTLNGIDLSFQGVEVA